MAKKKKEEQYHVEVIIAARVSEDSGWEYLVKWAGYKSSDNSWEPDENVASCERLLKSFWRNFPGDEDKDYPVGTELEAPKAWIEQETEYFWKNYEGVMKREFEDEDTKNERGRSRSRKGVKREASTVSLRGEGSKRVKQEPATASSSSAEEESISISPPRKKRIRRASKHVDSDSSDDTPLKKIPRMSSASTLASRKGKEKAGSATTKTSASAPVSKAVTSQPKDKVKEPAESARKVQGEANKVTARAPSPAHSLFSEPDEPLSSQPASSQPSEAPGPPAKHTPAHRAPGKVKILPFQDQNTASGSTIATKQRIAMGNAPKPTHAPPPPPPAPVYPIKKPLLSQLSFKKKPKASEDNMSPQSPQVASATSSTAGYEWGVPRPGESSRLAGIRRIHDSPAPMSDAPSDHDVREPTPPSAGPSRQLDRARDPRLNALRRQSTNTSAAGQDRRNSIMEDAEKFLLDMMPPEMAAPMVEPAGTEDVPPVTPTVAPPIPQAPKVIQPPQNPMVSRIPKKWKWSGELYMDTNQDSATKLCDISLTDPTEPRPGGLRLNICLTSADSLRLKKLHSIWDLSTMLQASEAVQQFCKMVPRDSDDADPLKTLHTFMIRKEMFTYAHVYLDHNPVALLIVFPSAHTTICRFLRPGRIMEDEGGLIGALVPWSLASEQYQKSRWTKPRQLISADHQLDPAFTDIFKASIKQKLVTNLLLQHGLRLHKFPKRLYDSLSRRPFCIWFSPSDGPPNKPGYETTTLKTILSTCGAIDVGYKRDVNAMFIHVGALNTMYKVPAMANRRAKQPDLRFFTYGTHETIHQSRWGLREVYPLGGCVTFTPSVFLEDPIGIYEMIRKFDDHPLWGVFLPPNVIGVISKLVSHGQDPLELYDSKNFVFTPLIEMIEKGKIALLTAPPQNRYPKESISTERKWDDPAMDWITTQCRQIPMDGRQLLEFCLQSLQEHHPNESDDALIAGVGRETMEEMRQMQFQPALMESYRRYVVIKAKKDSSLNDRTETIECVPLNEFRFRDEAFDPPRRR